MSDIPSFPKEQRIGPCSLMLVGHAILEDKAGLLVLWEERQPGLLPHICLAHLSSKCNAQDSFCHFIPVTMLWGSLDGKSHDWPHGHSMNFVVNDTIHISWLHPPGWSTDVVWEVQLNLGEECSALGKEDSVLSSHTVPS